MKNVGISNAICDKIFLAAAQSSAKLSARISIQQSASKAGCTGHARLS